AADRAPRSAPSGSFAWRRSSARSSHPANFFARLLQLFFCKRGPGSFLCVPSRQRGTSKVSPFRTSRAIAVAAAVAAAAGCGRKPPLPPGLDRVAPGAPVDELRRAAPAFAPAGADPSLLVTREGYLCFSDGGRALALGDGLMTVVYRLSDAD